MSTGPLARSSGSSPAAILEQETEDLHHDRERVEDKELDSELPVSLRSGAVRCELPRIGSLSHVFRKQGIHIVANPVTEVVADSADFIEPGD